MPANRKSEAAGIAGVNLLLLNKLLKDLQVAEAKSGDTHRWRIMVGNIASFAGALLPLEEIPDHEMETVADKYVLRHLRNVATLQPDDKMHLRLYDLERDIDRVSALIDRQREFASLLDVVHICLRAAVAANALYVYPARVLTDHMLRDLVPELIGKAKEKIADATKTAVYESISTIQKWRLPLDVVGDIQARIDVIAKAPTTTAMEALPDIASKTNECELLFRGKIQDLEKWRRHLMDKRNDEFFPYVVEAIATLPPYLRDFVPHKYHTVSEPNNSSPTTAL